MLKPNFQDHNDRIWINLDPYLRQIFMTDRIRFADIPGRLHPLLTPPGKILESPDSYFYTISRSNRNPSQNQLRPKRINAQ